MKNNKIRKIVTMMTARAVSTLMMGTLTACGEEEEKQGTTQADSRAKEPVELTILAAASLTDVCNEIKTLYEAANPNVTLTFSYGGSGALQTQIEEGAPADLFLSAATKQMTALQEQGLMEDDSIVQLLENKVVLIVPADSSLEVASFEDVTTDKVTMIGLGEPGSVPVGQYSEEIFTTLGTLDEVKAKANYGSDVRTVLSWVETSAVDCGVVYATDAYTTDRVKIVCEAPEGSCKRVIYPAGIVKASGQKEEAAKFLEYLQSDETSKLFASYGFSLMN
ncbi:MAG: molybdate ABC transporter substrate-binding protein [Lachnospiraceae bacterium]|nr:molybdate ABC transporter substrate-binding protein [Lachnospiraceae bacterium]